MQLELYHSRFNSQFCMARAKFDHFNELALNSTETLGVEENEGKSEEDRQQK